jgi:hypothetical protein
MDKKRLHLATSTAVCCCEVVKSAAKSRAETDMLYISPRLEWPAQLLLEEWTEWRSLITAIFGIP